MRRRRWVAATVLICALLAAVTLRERAAHPFARLPRDAAVLVRRAGYWQQARLQGAARAGLLAALARVRASQGTPGAGAGEPAGHGYRLTIADSAFVFWPSSGTLAASGRRYRVSPLVDLALRQVVAQVERRFHGELVTWAEAQQMLPRRGDATVVDLATGLHLRVRRLAGSHHADVQPLTAFDSAVLRSIYGGEWSWARRPVLVETGGRRLAASMNGMPHGAGSIEGNDFPGHFCIHFLLSEVHRSRKIDPGHLLAILAAAGVTPANPMPLPENPAAPAALATSAAWAGGC